MCFVLESRNYLEKELKIKKKEGLNPYCTVISLKVVPLTSTSVPLNLSA